MRWGSTTGTLVPMRRNSICLIARSRVEQPIELFVADGQRIAAGQQHVAHFGVRFEIGERLSH